MKKLGTILATLTLALTACSTGEDSPSRSNEIADLNFPDIDALETRIADRYNGTVTETTDGPLEGEIIIDIQSKGFELSDQGETVKVLEEVGNAAQFDYEWIAVTSSTDTGNWGYRYTPEQVTQVAEGNIIVTDVWDLAEDGANFAY